MANEVTVQDPFGKAIHLSPGFFFKEKESDDIYDDAGTVIKKPAIVVEVAENNEVQLYYFRSVGWNSTLLVTVHLKNGRWEAFDFIKDPSSEMLLSILKRGKQML